MHGMEQVVVSDTLNDEMNRRSSEAGCSDARKNPDSVAQIMTNAEIQCRILALRLYLSVFM